LRMAVVDKSGDSQRKAYHDRLRVPDPRHPWQTCKGDDGRQGGCSPQHQTDQPNQNHTAPEDRVKRKKYAESRGHSLAACKTEEDRKHMTEDGKASSSQDPVFSPSYQEKPSRQD